MSDYPTFEDFKRIYALPIPREDQVLERWNGLSTEDKCDAILFWPYRRNFYKQINFAYGSAAYGYLVRRDWKFLPAAVERNWREQHAEAA